MSAWINRHYGTTRGLVRLALSRGEVALGMAGERPPGPGEAIERLVFVCYGNICRSAFAQGVARRAGLAEAGFGLSTTTGMGAHPPVIEEAARRGIDLSGHRTVSVADHVAQPGDLLLAMEVRHLHMLAAIPALAETPRLLLGRFARPSVPHLHDPYLLDAAYLPVCLDRIEDAVGRLGQTFPTRAG